MDDSNLSTEDKIINGYYETKLPEPVRPAKPTILGSVDDLLSKSPQQIEAARVQHVLHKEALLEFEKAKRDRKADADRLIGLFRNDLEKEFGMAGHPKRHKVWDLAWDRGHSDGLYSVYSEYETLSDLLGPK